MASVTLSEVRKAYSSMEVIHGIDLEVQSGEFLVLVGPSGCGKSTLAHIAAGLVDAREGRVARGYARHAMVFQDPCLMPWATAEGNIAFALKLARWPRHDRAARVAAAAAMAELEPEDLAKYPVELSGGMRQRVAIARALAPAPDFIFFDEPFTALDVALKRRMQDLVIAAAQAARFGALFITHDLAEAARIAHRIAVLDAQGAGLRGVRDVPGLPGGRSDAAVFATVQNWLTRDQAFAHVHDVDERRRA